MACVIENIYHKEKAACSETKYKSLHRQVISCHCADLFAREYSGLSTCMVGKAVYKLRNVNTNLNKVDTN